MSTDPAFATKALTEFRDSEQAYGVSASFVSMLPQLSPTAQFQAVSAYIHKNVQCSMLK